MLSETKYVSAVRAIKLINCIKPQFKNNISVFLLNRAGKLEIGHLNRVNLEHISRLLRENVPIDHLRYSISLRLPGLDDQLRRLHYSKRKWVDLGKLTSKELREARCQEVPMCVFKNGLLLNPSECINWLNNLRRLTSTGHKNAVLRAIHGDIYSQERLFRFGLSDTPNCKTCGEIETINHKILECEYAATRWEALASITHVTANPAEINFAMGAHESCSLATLTIHAELIARLIRNTGQHTLPRLSTLKT